MIKGIQSVEDALRAHAVGCEGIVVTNHAGRQVDGAVGSLEVLPEIVHAVGDSEYPSLRARSPPLAPRFHDSCPDLIDVLASGRVITRRTAPRLARRRPEMKIIFDSGIRTGADVFKALALGAHAVQVGRLYVWGMSHEGEAGYRHVIKSLLAVSTRI